MKTKIVYVLASSQEDYFLEQCLISLKFLRKYNLEAYVVLVCDDTTESSLNGNRQDIKLLINELKSIQFERPVNKVERSRLMKVNLRKYVEGDFLYIDCDTIIVNDLSEIDNFTFSIGAVLDGHQPLKSHPMRSYFKKQNQHLNYNFDEVLSYYSGGVMYSKDDESSHDFYAHWYNNYLESLKSGVKLDEPPLAKTNEELGGIICEMNGIWNCQIRFGALYLANAKILHFCSKKNMPVNNLARREFLYKIKERGLDIDEMQWYLENWHRTIPSNLLLSTNIDANFNLSRDYEDARSAYVIVKMQDGIFQPQITTFKELYNHYRNIIIGKFNPMSLAKILFKEKFGYSIENEPINSLNRKLFNLAFFNPVDIWTTLADKLAVRKFVKSKGCADILLTVYKYWDNVGVIDFSSLPNSFVLKCNHDNGSTILVYDKFSVDKSFIEDFYRRKLSLPFGIETAEPHYLGIKPFVFAEELLENDKQFSSGLVSYKFFSVHGKAKFCQVIYDTECYDEQKSQIYETNGWIQCPGYILKNEGRMKIPQPTSLMKMLEVVERLSSEISFCRVDLYEYHGRVYFSEMTLMPAAGRINNFSQELLCLIGKNI